MKLKYPTALSKRGVPLSVLEMEPFSIQDSLSEFTIKIEGQIKRIRPSNQMKVFNETYRNCNGLRRFTDYWTYYISGKTDANKARYCAALLMDSYQHHCYRMLEKNQQIRLPYWHTIQGFKDKLIEHDLQEKIGIPGFLVIDGLYKDTTTGRIDRVRDLLNMYNHIPTILIGAGFDPVEMCRECLYIMPNKMMYFEDSFETMTI